MRLRRFAPFLSALALIPFSCAKPKPANTPPEKPAQTRKFDEGDLLRATFGRYIQIAISDKEGANVGTGTAVRISKTLALSVFHALQTNCLTLEITRTGKAEPLQLIAPPDTLHDLIAFRPHDPFDGEAIPLAEKVEVGETVADYSNAMGRNGFFRKYSVARVSEDGELIELDRPTIPGESGAFLLNTKGELVGIVCQSVDFAATTKDGGKIKITVSGLAISSTRVRQYIETLEHGYAK